MRKAILAALAAAMLVLAGPGASPLHATGTSETSDRIDASTRRLLALNMYHEARGEGRMGMLAVGWVVLNRSEDRAFPRSIRDVIMQGADKSRCQWAWLCSGRDLEPRNSRMWDEALALADELLNVRPPDPTGGALWFRQIVEGDPDWGQVVRTARIGNHIFYARDLGFEAPRRRPGKGVQTARLE
ncbi:cell wall hydrolase [Geminicoccaceae bacterium 1502E]|nr:cell wall hydrolase [Geminicoccaceae bacterium 1502E]